MWSWVNRWVLLCQAPLMAPCCGETLELVGTIPGAHSGCPLLPHGELSRSDLGLSDWNFDV